MSTEKHLTKKQKKHRRHKSNQAPCMCLSWFDREVINRACRGNVSALSRKKKQNFAIPLSQVKDNMHCLWKNLRGQFTQKWQQIKQWLNCSLAAQTSPNFKCTTLCDGLLFSTLRFSRPLPEAYKHAITNQLARFVCKVMQPIDTDLGERFQNLLMEKLHHSGHT